MIRILKGNHRKLYFVVLAEIFNDGINKLCSQANDNCNSCLYADVCDTLMNAQIYCERIADRMKS